jgi:oligoribonuclease
MDDIKPEYIWIDLETTGLDATDDIPLEVALVLTDEWGTELAEATWLVHDDTAAFKEKVYMAAQHPIIGPMHSDSGLFAALANREAESYGGVYEVDQWMTEFLQQNGVEKGTLPLAGNSIGSLDRPFCLSYFHMFNDWTHYRNVDISSFKEVCRKTNPTLYAQLEPIIGTKADATHRALDDVKASIREYKAYIDNFFFTE